jgi:NAD(P)H-hydrate epimerase
LCGEIVVADIGIPPAAFESLSITAWENDPALWRTQLPQARTSGNKYTRGHALLRGGYPVTGAARLAARAAARIGAGLTTIAVPEAAFSIYASALTSIMVQPLTQDGDFARLLGDSRYSAFLVGPGAASMTPPVRLRCRSWEPRGLCCSMQTRSACLPPELTSWRERYMDPVS